MPQMLVKLVHFAHFVLSNLVLAQCHCISICLNVNALFLVISRTNTNATYFARAKYGQGSGKIWLDEVSCRGNETDIAQCMYNPLGVTNCAHREDVSIGCYPSNYFNTFYWKIDKC